MNTAVDIAKTVGVIWQGNAGDRVPTRAGRPKRIVCIVPSGHFRRGNQPAERYTVALPLTLIIYEKERFVFLDRST